MFALMFAYVDDCRYQCIDVYVHTASAKQIQLFCLQRYSLQNLQLMSRYAMKIQALEPVKKLYRKSNHSMCTNTQFKSIKFVLNPMDYSAPHAILPFAVSFNNIIHVIFMSFG
jgi:hypothetical protein